MNIELVKFQAIYAQAISKLIIRNFFEVNIQHYSHQEMQALSLNFTPERIIDYNRWRKVLVALYEGYPVGTGGYAQLKHENNREIFGIFSVFVLPEMHGRGIGTLLMQKLEVDATTEGAKIISLWASETAREFYSKLGYRYLDNLPIPDENGLYRMEKNVDNITI